MYIFKSLLQLWTSAFSQKTFCCRNVRSCLIWKKIGTCDIYVDANVTNYVNFCYKHVKGAKDANMANCDKIISGNFAL